VGTEPTSAVRLTPPELAAPQALLNQTGGDVPAALARAETPVSDALFDRDIAEHALLVLVAFRDRLTAYTQDARAELAAIVAFSDGVAERLGLGADVAMDLPLHTVLLPLRFLRLFLDQVQRHSAPHRRRCGQRLGTKTGDLLSIPTPRAL
jgi:hypothetical protein